MTFTYILYSIYLHSTIIYHDLYFSFSYKIIKSQLISVLPGQITLFVLILFKLIHFREKSLCILPSFYECVYFFTYFFQDCFGIKMKSCSYFKISHKLKK